MEIVEEAKKLAKESPFIDLEAYKGYDDNTTLYSPVRAATANTEEVGLKESKYLMELTTRKAIVFKVFANCIIFVQVSESCPYGCHL